MTNTYYQYGAGLVNRPGLREHNSANYGTSFLYRGNVTRLHHSGSVYKHELRHHRHDSQHDDGTERASPFNLPRTIRRRRRSRRIIWPNLQTTQTYTSFLAPDTTTQPNAANTKTEYDAYARVSKTTSPDGAVVTYSYDPATASPPRR